MSSLGLIGSQSGEAKIWRVFQAVLAWSPRTSWTKEGLLQSCPRMRSCRQNTIDYCTQKHPSKRKSIGLLYQRTPPPVSKTQNDPAAPSK
eukprot:1312965-Amphidinium_carterae.1